MNNPDNLDIAALAAQIANQGSKGPPMSTRDALRLLARTSADPRVRELARQRMKRGAPVLWIGYRFANADPGAVGPLYHDKVARGIHRRRAVRSASRIESALDAVRKRNADTRALASNSHEARRAIEEDRRMARAR